MSEVLQYRLIRNKDIILKDLEAEQVLDYLYQEDVLDDDQYEEVSSKGPRKEQSALLLKYVERDSSAIQKMIDRLQRSSQRHLAKILNEPLSNEVELSRGVSKMLEQDSPNYSMRNVPCGYAVIINNAEFDNTVEPKLGSREGSEVDVIRMTELFEWLQFNVAVYINKTADEIESIVRKYGVDIDHNNFDCFVLFLMSHGFEDGIFGSDNKKVFMANIRRQLIADKCYSLANKPKLIFVQACRGGKTDKGFVVTDSPISKGTTKPSQEISGNSNPTSASSNLNQPWNHSQYHIPDIDVQYIPQDADMFITYASTANHAALRNTTTGGWFVTQLYEVFRDNAEKEDLQSMITKVTGHVSSIKHVIRNTKDYAMQCPEHTGNLRKKLFFNPKKS
ncbi:caspase-8-like [Dendronephthya gigantea]|uniref:caspase-8-like n=1 Tax=Dendronephthya gigantea TaxID=151771 RepID=UPI00106ABE1F|nr:caspase-8-like [Dendronephthya gigantea]